VAQQHPNVGELVLIHRGSRCRTGSVVRDTRRRVADEAFERFVVPELAVLVRMALSLTGHRADADDLVQETLLRAYRSIHRFDGRFPRAWLLTIMRNAHLNRVRAPRSFLVSDPAVLAPEHLQLDDSAEAVVVAGSMDPAIERAVARLPDPLRRVLELVDVQGLSYLEAARVLRVRVETVTSRLHRARRRLRAHVTRR
jgi:RNA polymerase sigma-70 factor, ECF subfamily